MQRFAFPWSPNNAIPPAGRVCVKRKNSASSTPQPSEPRRMLFEPIKMRNVTFKNRIVVSPMCQYSANDGFMNDYHLVHLGQFALGGAGLIFVEATAVEPAGRISPHDVGLWKPEHIPSHQRVVDFVKATQTAIGIQLAHAGRKGSTRAPFWGPIRTVPEDEGGWNVVGPSPIPWSENYATPHELTKDEIKSIIERFATAAKWADEIGYDVVEIHGAHGYLISQFNSPISNKRTDEYGGSFENRTRFALEVARAVREVWPQEKPLWFRLSCTEWCEGGWTLDDSIKLAQELKKIGVDVLDCSSGGTTPLQKVPVGPEYQVPFAKAIRESVGMPTGAVGLITEPLQAENILQRGDADFVLLGREFLRDPHWPLRAARELGVDVEWMAQYNRAKIHAGSNIP